ncbi:MAG: hypothetical protein K2L82_11110 [Lachnospiraceae bacterium]|nr:hypothetical protein [Lachnospiraceae bacterium]
MRKNLMSGIIVALLLMIIPCYAVYADLEAAGSELKSYGNIIYEDENGSVQIYAEDIEYLREKIMSIPEDIFESSIYSHVHDWKYINVNDETHTRTCEKCGSLHDVTNVHKPVKSEECSLEYHSGVYGGYLHMCKCGYTWETEREHNHIFSVVDGTSHKVACALAGTKFCEGMEEYDEAHILSVVPGGNDTHTITCKICTYEEKEDCIYSIENVDGATGERRLVCECGNYIIEEQEPDPTPDPGDNSSVSANNLITQYERED